MQWPIKSINRVTDLDTQMSKEIDLFSSGGSSLYVNIVYCRYFGTILPISVDCERCFSTAPYVDYKIHSDDMLDALILLKNYLNQLYLFWNFRDFWIPKYSGI